MAFIQTTFLTDAVKHPKTVWGFVPTDKIVVRNKYLPAKKPMKTLYFLEGLTGSSNGPAMYAQLQQISEDYNLAIFCIDSDNKWYADSEISGDHYMTLVVKDLINYTRQTFNLSDKREDTYIGGFSMGGYGAFVCGFNRPDLFSHIIGLSAALNKYVILNAQDKAETDMFNKVNYATMFGISDVSEYADSVNDYEYMARKVAESDSENMPKIHMAVGTVDILHDLDFEYYEYLKGLGYDITMKEVENGGHSFYTLHEGLKDALQYLPLDTFRGNVRETGIEQNFNPPEFFSWEVYYNVINDMENTDVIGKKLENVDKDKALHLFDTHNS